MGDGVVRYGVERGVATIMLDSVENRNALSQRMRQGLLSHLRKADDDPAVRVIVLTHAGTVFCSGMDLREAQDADAAHRGTDEFKQILINLWNSPKPIVARLAGHARAGGIGMVAAADIALATNNVTFAFSEVRIGVAPAIISVPILPKVSRRAIHELFLTGEKFDADKAVHIGLLNAVCHPKNLDDEVERYLGALRKGSPHALAATKHILNSSDISAQLTEMATLSAELFSGPDAREGMAAFTEKRAPRWVHY